VLKTGAPLANFQYEPENGHGTVYTSTSYRFQKAARAACLGAADGGNLPRELQFQRLGVEAANLSWSGTMPTG